MGISYPPAAVPNALRRTLQVDVAIPFDTVLDNTGESPVVEEMSLVSHIKRKSDSENNAIFHVPVYSPSGCQQPEGRNST